MFAEILDASQPEKLSVRDFAGEDGTNRFVRNDMINIRQQQHSSLSLMGPDIPGSVLIPSKILANAKNGRAGKIVRSRHVRRWIHG